MQLKRLLTPILVVGLVTLAGAGCGRVTVRGADSASDNTQATQVSTDHGSKVMRASKTFAEVARGNESTAKARVVGLVANRGDGTETVTFTFADTKVLPKYLVKYVPA
ncbi:MAG TPA: hypothetical protein VE287_11720, partial [Actinopolymorphaceae bacterium]|nr:hypothetical protein [Actinopolymorphaceae bacterium]